VTIQQAWMVMSLAPVECYLPDDIGGWHPFYHLATNVREEVRQGGRPVGDTVWGGVVDGQPVAVGWDWVEARPGVMCLLDPNSIVTNIRFLDDGDTYQEPLQAIISANRLTHHWPWQSTVAEVLRNHTATHPVERLAGRRLAARPQARTSDASELRRAA
jgi:hypothetical protein